MNECKFNDASANIRLTETIKETYNKLDNEPAFSIDEKFNIFKPFFEGLETGLDIGVFHSGVSTYLTPPILVKIRFIITSVIDLGTKETWRLLGHQIK